MEVALAEEGGQRRTPWRPVSRRLNLPQAGQAEQRAHTRQPRNSEPIDPDSDSIEGAAATLPQQAITLGRADLSVRWTSSQQGSGLRRLPQSKLPPTSPKASEFRSASTVQSKNDESTDEPFGLVLSTHAMLSVPITKPRRDRRVLRVPETLDVCTLQLNRARPLRPASYLRRGQPCEELMREAIPPSLGLFATRSPIKCERASPSTRQLPPPGTEA